MVPFLYHKQIPNKGTYKYYHLPQNVCFEVAPQNPKSSFFNLDLETSNKKILSHISLSKKSQKIKNNLPFVQLQTATFFFPAVKTLPPRQAVAIFTSPPRRYGNQRLRPHRPLGLPRRLGQSGRRGGSGVREWGGWNWGGWIFMYTYLFIIIYIIWC